VRVIVSNAITDEGRGEITAIRELEVTVDASTRALRYRAVVDTIYGEPFTVASG